MGQASWVRYSTRHGTPEERRPHLVRIHTDAREELTMSVLGVIVTGWLIFSATLIIGIWTYQFALLKFGRENDE